jgi:hypothetical protein
MGRSSCADRRAPAHPRSTRHHRPERCWTRSTFSNCSERRGPHPLRYRAQAGADNLAACEIADLLCSSSSWQPARRRLLQSRRIGTDWRSCPMSSPTGGWPAPIPTNSSSTSSGSSRRSMSTCATPRPTTSCTGSSIRSRGSFCVVPQRSLCAPCSPSWPPAISGSRCSTAIGRTGSRNRCGSRTRIPTSSPISQREGQERTPRRAPPKQGGKCGRRPSYAPPATEPYGV